MGGLVVIVVAVAVIILGARANKVRKNKTDAAGPDGSVPISGERHCSADSGGSDGGDGGGD